jgi:DNA-binding XRE family transcriptional regulator
MDEKRLYRLVGARVRTIREGKRPKMSQQTLGNRVNKTRVSIVNVEAGRQHPPLHLLWEIAEVLDVPVTDLLPTAEELLHAGDPVSLDEQTVAMITAAANGDENTRHRLSKFISEAKSVSREKKQ